MAGKVQKIRIGSVAPDFEADSTQGRIRFYDHIGDGWAILLCYPDDFTPVATTELVIFSFLQPQLAERGVKLLAISTDNRPAAGGNRYVSHKQWVKDVDDISPTAMDFPIVEDQNGSISRSYNVLDKSDVERISSAVTVTTGLAFESRTIFIIGPQQNGKHFVRLILNYPPTVGVSNEVLRAVDALQAADYARIRTPANWGPGDDVVIPLSTSDEEARKAFPDFKPVKPYLRFANLPPKKNTDFESLYFLRGSLVSINEGRENGKPKIEIGATEHPIDPIA